MSETTNDGQPPAHEPDDAGHGHDDRDAFDVQGVHGGHDAHGPALGPIDWFAWGAGILGLGAGVVVAACLYIATTL